MALQDRRFKIGFFDSLTQPSADIDFVGLFNCTVTALQFSYDATVDPGISQLLRNGTWMGLIGLVNRSEVDFAPDDFIVTERRSNAVVFNYPYTIDEITFVARKLRYSPEIMALFQTFSLSVWLSLLVSAILVMSISFIALKYRCSLGDVIFHVLAVSFYQRGTIIPRRAGEFLLLCTWTVAMTLLAFCFKSVLLSFLSFPPLSGVRNVPELAAAIRAGRYSAMTKEKILSTYLPRYLRDSLNDDIRLIGENILETPPGSIDDLLNKSLENRNVVYVSKRAWVAFAEENLYVSKDTISTILTATAVSKNFCCKDDVDRVVHRFMAAGIDQKINRFRDFKSAFERFSEIPDDDKARKITMTDISGAFVILLAGYCLSVCVLIIERKIKNRDKHHSIARRKKKTRILFKRA